MASVSVDLYHLPRGKDQRELAQSSMVSPSQLAVACFCGPQRTGRAGSTGQKRLERGAALTLTSPKVKASQPHH